MFDFMKTFALCVCACCVADTIQHGVLLLFGEGITWETYFDVSKPLGCLPKKLEIQVAVLNSSKVSNPMNVSERRFSFQGYQTEIGEGKKSHNLYPGRNYVVRIWESEYIYHV